MRESQDQPAGAKLTPEERKRARRIASWALGTSLIGVVAVFGALWVILSRRRARMHSLKSHTAAMKAKHDPWREAAKRMVTPSAAKLDDDLLDMEDTRIIDSPRDGREPDDEGPSSDGAGEEGKA